VGAAAQDVWFRTVCVWRDRTGPRSHERRQGAGGRTHVSHIIRTASSGRSWWSGRRRPYRARPTDKSPRATSGAHDALARKCTAEYHYGYNIPVAAADPQLGEVTTEQSTRDTRTRASSSWAATTRHEPRCALRSPPMPRAYSVAGGRHNSLAVERVGVSMVRTRS
jgi:hypothetical protein